VKPRTIEQLRSIRLRNQRIAGSTAATAQDVVASLGAVQAQEFWPAKWALGLRSMVSEADVDHELDEGRIVRTHILRPTWHFVSAADIRWMLSISGPRVQAVSSYYYRKHGMTAPLVLRSQKVIARALEGRAALTRNELGERLVKARIKLFDNLLAHLVMHAELEGLVCSGPRRGRQSTYMLLDERVPPTRVPSREDALAELARRYFTSHGPAKIQDFVWWSGMTVRDAKTALEALAGAIVAETFDGEIYWMAPSSPPGRRPANTVDLLPIYDEYLIAYRDRRAVAEPKEPADGMQHDIFAHYLMIDGTVAGSWRKRDAGGTTDIALKPYRPLSRPQLRAARGIAHRLASFTGREVRIA